ncbi:hypothetical protein niasHT_023474 [Heterodera trifolii]|uniref:FLYWCH-type domain-containing protein n=1 Tax=Heterodera trifolii TaxID=157864 RepID=A0ABD2JJ47_9BILA
MQKSQITFAPVSSYTLRKQKRPISRSTEEPPPVLTKGSETEFDSCEEPPPPLLEAETATDGDGSEHDFVQNGSIKSVRDLSVIMSSAAEIGRAAEDSAANCDPPAEPFILESRHLPSWFRNCPGCHPDQNSELLFRGRIAGGPQSGPIVSIECAFCGSPIYNSDCHWERRPTRAESVEKKSTKGSQSACDLTDNELEPSTSAAEIGGKTADKTQAKLTNRKKKEIGFDQNYSHQFGLSFPVMFETEDGQRKSHCERITFRGFVYCHVSRQVKTRGGGDSVSYWRCQQRIDPLSSNCSGLIRLEGKNLTFVKGHKHPPDYAATREILANVREEYTRLYLVAGRKGRTRHSEQGTVASASNSAPLVLRPFTDRGALRRVTSQTERRANDLTDESATMETEELIRSITARKELLTVKVSPST